MKITTLIKGDTANKLLRAEEDLAATDQQIAADQQQRLDLLLDGEPSEVAALDQRIIDRHRVRTVYQERVAGLRDRHAQELLAERQKQRAAAIVAVEKMLPERLALIREGVTAAKEFIAFSDKLGNWHDKFLKRYPVDLEGVIAHYVDDRWIMKNLLAAILMEPDEARATLDELVLVAQARHTAAIADLQAAPISNTESEAA